MGNLLISVIVPIYNVEKYLPQCIDYLLCQTYRHFELILIDDGAIDRSGRICDEYASKDERVRVIHKKNEGVSTARNTGIEEAKGDYICFIDSDDWVDCTYLEDFVKAGLKAGGIIYSGIINEYDDGSDTPACKYDDCFADKNLGEIITTHKLIHNGYPVAKIFCRETIMKYKIRFDASISFHEDHLFVLKYLQHATSVATVSNMSYHYMHHGTGTSLSSKKHCPQNLVYAGEMIGSEIYSIIKRFTIADTVYIQKAYTDVALNHIMTGLLQSSKQEEVDLLIAFNTYHEYFANYYYPNNIVARICCKILLQTRNLPMQKIVLQPIKALFRIKYGR